MLEILKVTRRTEKQARKALWDKITLARYLGYNTFVKTPTVTIWGNDYVAWCIMTPSELENANDYRKRNTENKNCI